MTSLTPDKAPAAIDASRAEPAERRAPRRLWRTREEREAAKARARAIAAREAIEEQRALDQREMERLEAQREMAALRDELADRAQRHEDKAATQRKTIRQRISRAVVLATANIGVNAVAVLGQVLALVLSLKWEWYAAVPLALVVESVAVNIGYIAHDKLINGYSAGWLRALSYGIGAGVGWFNYSHNEAIDATRDFAGVFGAASLLSPVLWQIYSQWRHWQELRDRNLLDMQAPKFSRARWILWLGETFYIVRRAVRHGVSDRAEAVRRFQPEYERTRRKTRKATKPLPPAADELSELLDRWSREFRQRGPEVDVDRDQFGDRVASNGASTSGLDGKALPPAPKGRLRLKQLVSWSRPNSRPDAADADDEDEDVSVDADLDAKVDAKTGEDASRTRPDADGDDDRAEPTEQDKKRVARWWVKRVEADEVLSKWGLADRTGFKPTWCGDRIPEGKQILARKGWTFDDRGRPVRPVEVDADSDAELDASPEADEVIQALRAASTSNGSTTTPPATGDQS